MENVTSVSNATPSGEAVALEAFKGLSKLRISCGLERGRPRFQITFDQQQLFPHARTECFGYLTGNANSFIQAKTEALELLYDLLIFDPLDSEVTANGLTALTKDLQFLMEEIENELPRLQAKYAKTFGAALDCMVCHYTLNHLGRVTEDTKQLLKATPKVLKKLNKEDPEVHFYVAYAKEASKKLTSDRSKQDKILSGVVNFAKTCHAAYNLDLRETWSGLRATISELHFQKAWYEGILFQRKMLKEVWDSPANLIAFQSIVEEWGLEKTVGLSTSDWKYLMGTIDCLTELIIHSPEPEIAHNAFYGSSEGGNGPGLLDLLEFDAFKFKGRLKKTDTNWHIRYGVAKALSKVWTFGPKDLRVVVATTLLRHKAQEAEPRVCSLIDNILGQDRELQRSWKRNIIEQDKDLRAEKDKLTANEKKLEAYRKKIDEQKKLLHDKEEAYEEEVNKLRNLQKQLANRTTQIQGLTEKIKTLENEKSRLTAESAELAEKEDELLEATGELAVKKGALNRAQARFEKAKANEESRLALAEKAVDAEKIALFDQQKALKKLQKDFAEKNRLFDEQLEEFNLKFAQTKQLEEDAALAFNLQSFEYWEVEQRARKKFSDIEESTNTEEARPALSNEFPDALLCPISSEPMFDAVVAPSGHTYSEVAILKWLETKRTDPLTSTPLSPEDLRPNRALRELVQTHLGRRTAVVSTAPKKRFVVENKTEISLLPGNSPIHQQLYYAAAEGRLDDLLHSIKHGGNVYFRGERGNTPIHAAAEEGHAHIVEALLSNKAAIKTTNDQRLYPWDLALRKKHTSVILTIAEGCPQEHCYMLYQAVTAGSHNEALKALLASKPFLAAQDRKGQYLWDLALKNQEPQLLSPLVEHIPLNLRYAYLEKTIEGGHSQILQVLLDSSVFTQTKTEEGKFLWDLALDNNKVGVLTPLLPSIPSELRYPYFRAAVTKRHSEIVEFLLDDPSFCEGHNGKHLLDLAVEDNHGPAVLRLAMRIPKKDRYPFFKKVLKSKQVDAIGALTDSNKFILTTTEEGEYFWDLALKEDNVPMVSHLAEIILPEKRYDYIKQVVEDDLLDLCEVLTQNAQFIQTKDESNRASYLKETHFWGRAIAEGNVQLVRALLNAIPPKLRLEFFSNVADREYWGLASDLTTKWTLPNHSLSPGRVIFMGNDTDYLPLETKRFTGKSVFLLEEKERPAMLEAAFGRVPAEFLSKIIHFWGASKERASAFQHLDLTKYALDVSKRVNLNSLHLLPLLKTLRIDCALWGPFNPPTNMSLLTNLETLDLLNCGKLHGGLYSLFPKLISLKSLTFQGSSDLMSGNGGVRCLSSLVDLEYLNLNLCSDSSHNALEHFNKLRALKTLNLAGYSSNSAPQRMNISSTLKALNLSSWRFPSPTSYPNFYASLNNLQSLTVSQSTVNSGVFAKICAIPNLQILGASSCQYLPGSALQSLVSATQLARLDLSDNKFTDEDLSPLSGLTALETLSLSWCEHISGNGLQHLAPLSKLHTLDLSKRQKNAVVSSMKLQHLGMLPNLKRLNCTPTSADDLQPLTKNSSIATLFLTNFLLKDADFEHLSLPKLKVLRFNRSLYKDLTEKSLDFLDSSPELTTLTVRQCRKISKEHLLPLKEDRSALEIDVTDDYVPETNDEMGIWHFD